MGTERFEKDRGPGGKEFTGADVSAFHGKKSSFLPPGTTDPYREQSFLLFPHHPRPGIEPEFADLQRAARLRVNVMVRFFSPTRNVGPADVINAEGERFSALEFRELFGKIDFESSRGTLLGAESVHHAGLFVDQFDRKLSGKIGMEIHQQKRGPVQIDFHMAQIDMGRILGASRPAAHDDRRIRLADDGQKRAVPENGAVHIARGEKFRSFLPEDIDVAGAFAGNDPECADLFRRCRVIQRSFGIRHGADYRILQLIRQTASGDPDIVRERESEVDRRTVKISFQIERGIDEHPAAQGRPAVFEHDRIGDFHTVDAAVAQQTGVGADLAVAQNDRLRHGVAVFSEIVDGGEPAALGPETAAVGGEGSVIVDPALIDAVAERNPQQIVDGHHAVPVDHEGAVAHFFIVHDPDIADDGPVAVAVHCGHAADEFAVFDGEKHALRAVARRQCTAG